jgi:lipopolysaccharide biosynthesis glycosyltransferase
MQNKCIVGIKKLILQILTLFMPSKYHRHLLRQYFFTPKIRCRPDPMPYKKRAKINIAFAFDAGNAKQAAVAITSLLAASKCKCDYNIFCVIDKTVSGKDKEILNGIARGSGSALKFLQANKDFDNSLRGKWPLSVYYRLMLPKLLPDGADEVIYADVDVVFINDLAECANIDLCGNLIGAVLNGGSDSHVNSGFLIMNIKQIRKEKIYEKWISASQAGEMGFPDQDVLNDVCKGRILMLPIKYNISPDAMFYAIRKGTYSDRELNDLRYHAVMLHFYGKYKPWHKQRPYLSHIWQHYANQTGLF